MSKKSLFPASLLFMGLLMLHFQANCQEENWTHFRGTNLDGQAPMEKIPLVWDDSVIKWKTAIHDIGHSSPVVYGNQVWVTTATPDGKALYAVCTDFQTGKIIYDIKVFEPREVEGKHSLNSYASPTPCIEKGFVYVHYGSLGTACINTANGAIAWKRTDLKCRHVQGPASSPVLYGNLLILHYEGTDVRYLIALDKTSGNTVWKTDRPVEPYESLAPIGKKAYMTPLIINVKGKDMLISPGSAVCIAYEPATGKEIWRINGGAESTVAMPVTENGILYWYTGFMVDGNSKYTEMIAANPDGKGDITSTNILWKRRDELAQNQMLTPVIKDGLIYTVTTRNEMMCIDASDGKQLWSTHVTSSFNASPLFINGNVWFFSTKGEVLVLKGGREYEVISRSQVDSGIWATPAVIRNSVILRTQKFLCRIGN